MPRHIENTVSKPSITVPAPLSPGDTIAVYSPSSAAPCRFPLRFGRGLEKLRSLGYSVLLSNHATADIEGKAGTPHQRARDLEELFFNPNVKGIVASIGGNDARLVVPLIDWSRIMRHPKWFVGHSDTTAIHCALLSKASIASLYGPTVMTDFAEFPDMPSESEESFQSCICKGTFPPLKPINQFYGECPDWANKGGQEALRPRLSAPKPVVLNPGVATGRVVGGCIESLSELAESTERQWFTAGSGDILLLETSAQTFNPETLSYQLDTLKTSGCVSFASLEGVVFGAKCWTAQEYQEIAERLGNALGDTKAPAVIGLPIGHVTPCFCIPLGVYGRLNATKRDPSLSFI